MTRERIILFLVSALLAARAQADVISYIRFEEGSGFMAYDQTGLMDGELLGFPSVAAGAGDTGSEGWSTNVFAPTISLTGAANTGSLRIVGGFVDLSNPNTLTLGTNFTVEFFMKPDQPVIGSVAFGFAPVSALYLSLTESGGSLYFNSQFMTSMPYGAATGVETGEWQHVALVKEPGEYSIYLNGTLIINDALPSSVDGPYVFPGSITGDRTIGGESGTWRGWIDEVRISDTALTPDQFLIAVPEPGTLFLCFSGLATLFLSWLKRRFG